MASFMDYYQDELRKRGSSSAAAPKGVSLSSLSGGQKPEEEGGPMSAVNWVIDMISRPTYGMTNANKENIDRLSQGAEKFSQGDILGGIGDTISGLPQMPSFLSPLGGGPLDLVKKAAGNNTDAKFVEGLTSNDDKLKRTNSDLIEYATDEFGGKLDPTYEDVQDNVNPWVKGIGGFAADVALDPLTFLPGAAIAAPLKAVKAARGAKAVKGPRVVPGAALEDLPAAPPKQAAEPIVDNPFEGATGAMPEPELVPVGAKTAEAADEVNPFDVPSFLSTAKPTAAPAAAPAAPTAQAAESVVEALSQGQKLSQVLKTSPKVPGLKKEIEGLFTSLSKVADDAAPVEAKAFDQKAWLDDPDNMVELQLPGDAAPKFYTYGELDQIVRSAKGKTPLADAAFQAIKTGMSQAKATPLAAIEDGLRAYQTRIVQGGSALRDILGEELVDHLLSKTSTQSASRTLSKLDALFGGRIGDLDRWLGKNERLGQAVMPTFKQDLDAVKVTPKTPEVVDEAVEAIELSPVSKALGSVFREQNLPGTPEFLERYGKVARSNPVAKASDGTADWWRKTNTFTQFSLIKKLQTYISDRIESVTGLTRDKLYGPDRAAAQREAMESLGADVANGMETFGTPLHIGVKDDLVRLTFPEVYATVGKQMDELVGDADVTNLALHNGGTAIAPTRFLNVVHEAVVNPEATVDELAAFIRKKTLDSDGPNAGSELFNNLVKPKASGYHYLPNGAKRASAMAKAVGGRAVKGEKGVTLTLTKGGKLPEMLAQAIVDARPALIAAAEKNTAEWAARGIAEAQTLAGAELANLRRLATNETKAGQREYAAAVARRKDDIAKGAAEIAATPEGTQAAVLATDAALGDDAIEEAAGLVAQERHLKEGDTFEEAGQKATEKLYDDAGKAGDPRDVYNTPEMEPILATKTTPDMPPKQAVEKFDIGEAAHAKIQHVTGSLLERTGKMFNRNHGLAENTDRLLRAGNASGRFVTNAVIRPVKELSKRFSPETLSQGLKAVQHGVKLDPASELGQAAAGIETIVGKLFDLDTTSQSAMGNIFLETGAGLDQINAALRWAFRGDTGVQLSRATAGKEAREALTEAGNLKPTKAEVKARTDIMLKEQWRDWDLGDDAADALVRLGQAAGRVAEHRAVVTSFVKDGIRYGWAVKVPKGKAVPAGFVKVVDSSGASSFRGLLPKDVYVAKDIAPELARMDYLTTASRQLSGEAGDFVRSTLVPLTNTWKQGMTIYRVGHHVRNMIGNLSLQFVERGSRSMADAQKVALKLMGARNEFEGLDAIAALRSMGDETVPVAGDKLFTTAKYGDFSDKDIWDALNREGLLPTYAASEGLLTGEVKQDAFISRLLKPLDADNNPVGRLGAATSQNLDHAQRIHHFVQAVMQEGSKNGGKYGDIPREAMLKKVAEEVRKLHPDASMLTATENKLLKLIIPFYTWMRGVLPGAIESALQHPGRLMVFPKASYNLAVANGINPDSFSDPFPEDQMFPSFIREAALGPQFQVGDAYLRVNPGIAQFDLAQSLAVDPVRGAAGMVSPFIRVPAELLSGGSWATGGRINDAGEYLDQSIPGVNYLSNLTGFSTAGSVDSVLQGQGLDPQSAVEKGNKTDMDKWISFANLITGLGIQNLSRPNYINYAEIEKRNQASEK